MLCGDVCGKDAISFTVRNGFYRPDVDASACVGCLACEKHCPVLNPQDADILSEPIPYAAWTLDDDTRLGSSSGGAFMAIASYFLNQPTSKRNLVVGVEMHGLESRFVIVDNTDDLRRLQGTKYLQPKISGIYAEVKKLIGEENNVMFVGLPCHVNSLKRLLGDNYDKNQLLISDLICNGVPSRDLIKMDQQRRNIPAKEYISFRDKKTGHFELALTSIDENGLESRQPYEDSFFLKAFLPNYLMQESCYNCKYATLERQSDITFGDFWGCTYPKEIVEKGVSLVICNNPRSVELIKNIPALHAERIKWKECLPFNPRIACGKRFVGEAIPKWLKKRVVKMPLNFQKRLLTGEMDIVTKRKVGWIPYKYWTIYLKRKENRYRTGYIYELLKKLDHGQSK